MKIILCLCLIQVYSCLGDNEYAATMGDINLDHHQHGLFERPCSLQDMKCIRQVLSSQCPHGAAHRSSHAPPPDHRRIRMPTTDIPHANLTLLFNEVELSNLNDFKIMELYINKKNNMLVFEVQFDCLQLYAPHTEMILYRKGMEPLEVSDFLKIEYRDLSLTLTAPYGHYDKMSESHVFTFVSDAAPNYEMGPLYMQSRDYLVRRVMASVVNNVGLTLQEGFVSVGPAIMSVFLQNNVCG